MLKRIAIIYLLLITISCVNSGEGKHIDYTDSNKEELIYKNNEDSFPKIENNNEYFEDPIIQSYTKASDTLIISEDCVIFLWPDSLEVEEIKIKHPNSYPIILEDMIFYASQIAIALDSLNIKNFFSDKQILLIKNDEGDEIIKRKQTKNNILINKEGSKPIFFNSIDFDLDSCIKVFYPLMQDESINNIDTM